MVAFGLDYVSGPTPAEMKSVGVTFVCRYLSEVNQETQVKLLSRAEAQALSEAGIAVVSNYEWYAGRPLEGLASGVADARIAGQQHAACGGPASRPIYFSVDTDCAGEQTAAYFRGVASVLGLARTGAYGSYRVLNYLFDQGLITWGWQTYAWSYGAWEPRCHIQQYQNGVSMFGHSVDYDRSIRDDFGQWRVATGGGGNTMTTIPAGWRDDGTTLVAPNGVYVVLGFREYVLAHNWDPKNVPLGPQYYTKQLEASHIDLGDGDQILFLKTMLAYPHNPVGAVAGLKNKVVEEYAGLELSVTRDQVAKFYPAYAQLPDIQQQLTAAQEQVKQLQDQIATLSTQLQQSQAQISAEQEQIKALEAELANNPGTEAIANRLTALGLLFKQASQLTQQGEQLVTQPLTSAAPSSPAPES